MGERPVIVTGPNHALHFVLSVLTCGLWLIPWLIIALNNNKRIQTVNEAGHLVTMSQTVPKTDWKALGITVAVVVVPLVLLALIVAIF